MRRDRRGRVFAALLGASAAARGAAHLPTESRLDLAFEGAVVAAEWSLRVDDLDYAFGVDVDGDGAVTWGELSGRRAVLERSLAPLLALSAGGEPCPWTPRELLVDRRPDGVYAVFRGRAVCPLSPGALTVDYQFLFDHDDEHKAVVAAGPGATLPGAELTATARRATFDRGPAARLRAAAVRGLGVARRLWPVFLMVLVLAAGRRRPVPPDPAAEGATPGFFLVTSPLFLALCFAGRGPGPVAAARGLALGLGAAAAVAWAGRGAGAAQLALRAGAAFAAAAWARGGAADWAVTALVVAAAGEASAAAARRVPPASGPRGVTRRVAAFAAAVAAAALWPG